MLVFEFCEMHNYFRYLFETKIYVCILFWLYAINEYARLVFCTNASDIIITNASDKHETSHLEYTIFVSLVALVVNVLKM